MKEYTIKQQGETIATTTSKRKADNILLCSLFAPGASFDVIETNTHKSGQDLTAYKNGLPYRTAIKSGDICKIVGYFGGCVLPCGELMKNFEEININDLLNI